MMGKLNPNLAKLPPGSPKDRGFCALFGVSAQIVVDAWKLMDDHGLLPDNPQLCHFLWALAFMCIYPENDKALSCLLGNRDPKTIQKHTWPFIQAVFELNDYFVSCYMLQNIFLLVLQPLTCIYALILPLRSCSRTERLMILEMIVSSLWMVQIFTLL